MNRMTRAVIIIFVGIPTLLAVILVALFGLTRPAGHNNAVNAAAPLSKCGGNGPPRDIGRLEDLPERDPVWLRPEHGEKLSAPNFWIAWETASRSTTRVIASRDQRYWVDLGTFIGQGNGVLCDFAYFENEVWFCIEFQDGEQRLRSPARRVRFAKGARFEQREQSFAASPGAESHTIALVGDDGQITVDDARWRAVPEHTTAKFGFAGYPGDKANGTLRFVVDPTGLEQSLGGYITCLDRRHGTIDRLRFRVEVSKSR